MDRILGFDMNYEISYVTSTHGRHDVCSRSGNATGMVVDKTCDLARGER